VLPVVPVGPVAPVGAVDDVPVVEVVSVVAVDDVPVAGFVVIVSVGTGTTVPEVSLAADVVVDSDVVALVSLVVVSVLVQANSSTAARADAQIHFM
jgi:hypothetical protein